MATRKRYDTRSRAERGYGADHERRRRSWKPQVDAGQVMCHAVVCLEVTRWIAPGADWHLGHTPDRSGWTGPEHPRCNMSEGGRRGNPRGVPKGRTLRIAPWHPTRDW